MTALKKGQATPTYLSKVLNVFVGAGFYHAKAYTAGGEDNHQNLDYKNNLDGQWHFISFTIKRVNG